MKFLHTSDWHLGHVLYGYDREEEQRDFVNQIVAIVAEQKPDAFVLSGDVFHTDNPDIDAQKLFIDAMLGIKEANPAMSIIVTAGNHDSYRRLEVNNDLWKQFNVNIVGVIARNEGGCACLDRHIIEVPDKTGNPAAYVLAVPHAFSQNFPLVEGIEMEDGENRPAVFFRELQKRAEELDTAGLPIILMAHLAVLGSDSTGHDFIGGLDNYPEDVLGEGYDYAALGHIHRPQNVGSKRVIRYSGTPVPVSFDEAYPHSVSMVTIDKYGDVPVVEAIEIKNLHPLITLPEKGCIKSKAELEQVLTEADSYNGCYIRLNMERNNDLNMAEVENRADEFFKERNCKFCYVNLKTNDAAATDSERAEVSIEDIKTNKISPIDIAKMHYERLNGCEMPEQMQKDLTELYLELLSDK